MLTFQWKYEKLKQIEVKGRGMPGTFSQDYNVDPRLSHVPE